jgi:predicted transcriptional regulator
MDYGSFKNIVIQREMHERYLEIAEENFNYYKKLLHKDAPREISSIEYEGMPSGNGNAMSLDRIYYCLQKYESMIEHETWTIENLKKLEKEIFQKVMQLDGLEYKVVYMRDIKGMCLQAIADELLYDIGYIKNISSKHKKVTFM